MLFIVADSTVVKIAFAEPVVSPAAYANNNTTPPPPPPPVPPPDEPQRPVEPGTVTQGWDNSSFAPIQIADHRDVAMRDSENETSYETTYGNFVLNKSSPYFVHFLSPGPDPQEIAQSAFLVLYEGLTLLSPRNGTVDNATSEELAFHYGLYLSAVLVGTMKVDYRFQRDTNNITISFSPSIGLPDAYQIVWLTFTTWDAVDTAAYPGGTERFDNITQGYGLLSFGEMGTLYGTGGYTRDGLPGAAIRPDKVGSDGLSLQMDVSDAVSDYGTSYAGKLTFGAPSSGNAVLNTFLPGHLGIDPSMLYAGIPQDATAYSGVQRKTFYDGQRYWIFWKDVSWILKYQSSVDGKSWGPSFIAAQASSSSATFPYGFTVANYGKTVALFWTDSSSLRAIQIRTGLIIEDTITWDDIVTGRQLYTHPCNPICHNVRTPVSATFTNQGNLFVVTWSDDGGGLGTQTYECTGPGSHNCASTVPVAVEPDFASGNNQFSVVVPFNGDTGSVARFKVDSVSGNSYFRVKIFRAGDSVCGDVSDIANAGYDIGSAWVTDGLFTAAASGSLVYLFFVDSAGYIVSYTVDINCMATHMTPDLAAVGPKNLTAGTQQDGSAVYLFLRSGTSPNIYINYLRYASSQPITGGPWQILTAYTNPYYLTAAQISSHFVPLMFVRAFQSGFDSCTASTTNQCLYFVNYPLPLDGEAAANNPWALKLGAPFINDVGGVVSPTTGLLVSGQTLIGGQPGIAIAYREPGLFFRDSGTDNVWSDPPGGYPVWSTSGPVTGLYYDLPWIDSFELHMQGGQRFPLSLTGQSGNFRWYNNTAGVRYVLKYDVGASKYTLTLLSGAYVEFIKEFTSVWSLNKAYLDTTGNNVITYTTDGGGNLQLTNIQDSSGRGISGFLTGVISYGNGNTVKLTYSAGVLQVTDTISRITKYTLSNWKLTKVESPNGARVNYTYADYSLGQQVSQGTEAYSLPLLRMDIYNESGANVKARSLAFSWNFQNGEVVRAVVNTTDKSAAVQGSNEYIFNSAAGTASVRVYDSAGQVLYYDMQTLNGANMKDLSGNGNDGTISNMADVYGKIGKARDTGTTGFIEVPGLGSLNSVRDITISAWFNPGTSLGTYSPIIEDYWSGSGFLLTLDTSVGGKLHWFVGKDGTNSVAVVSDAVPATGVWTHVVATAEAGGKLRMYVNGVLQADVKDITSIYPRTGYDWFIGTWVNSFHGSIDELRIFNRALSPEDAGILYTKNSLKKGEQQNWYSINDQPHMVEGFIGDETSASVVTQDAIDDWGNQIYHRDALGNDTFASYANTNHQNHFYAPGRLTKTTVSSTEFIDFGNGVFPTGQGGWVVTSIAATPAQIDYSSFDKIAPSLKIHAPTSAPDQTVVTNSLAVSNPRYIEFKARISIAGGAEFDVMFGTGSNYATSYMGIAFNGAFSVWDQSTQLWAGCSFPVGNYAYAANEWHRFTFEIDEDTSTHPWRLFVDGLTCTPTATLTLGAGHVLTTVALTLGNAVGFPSSSLYSWIDDIKIYSNANGGSGQSGYSALNIGFSGLQVRQSIRLLAENGSVIDQTMQTVSGTTLWLSFNSALTGAYTYYENGDNAKTAVQIYAEDGTLEYQSPLTRFFVGEQYKYTRPRAFADELVKTRSGALYWDPTYPIYADEPIDQTQNCPQGSSVCGGSGGDTWLWQQSPNAIPLRNTYAHITLFSYGQRAHWWGAAARIVTPTYFITYVRIPAGKSPDGIQFWIADNPPVGSCLYCWHQAFWGVPSSTDPLGGYLIGSSVNMGPVPYARDQWIQLVVNTADAGVGLDWDRVGYGSSGGEVDWDVTTTQTDASLTITGLSAVGTGSNNQIEVDYANNDTQIGIGPQSGDSASVLLYNRATGITAFPIQVKIRVFSLIGGIQEYYFGPLKNVWPGDSFRDVGSSSFFDSYVNNVAYWPSDSIHTALLGSKKFSGDCLDATLCYDMETLSEGATATDNTGIVTDQLFDLSQHSRYGRLVNAPVLGDITKSSGGLGLKLDGTSAYVDTGYDLPTGSMTLSAWIYADSLSSTDDVKGIMDKQSVTNEWRFNVKPSTGKLEFIGWTSSNAVTIDVYSTGAIVNGRLYHVAVTWDGTTATFYLNGVASGSGVKTGTAIADTTSVIQVGTDGASARYWNGVIDQVSTYNSVLSSTRILSLYYSRLPGGPQTYLRPQMNGLPVTSRVPYEGTYLYVAATYDSKGNLLSVTDAGRTINGGANVTNHEYSVLDGQDYLTKVTRPYLSDDSGSTGRPVYYAYDFQTGVKYGTLAVDCRRTRTQYDTLGRPVQTSVYGGPSDLTPYEVLHFDMETFDAGYIMDVSCASVPDSRTNLKRGTITGTVEVAGVDGAARKFVTANADHLTASLAVESSDWTLAAWIKPTSLPQLGIAVYNGQGGTNGYGFGIGSGTGATSGYKLTGLIGNTWFDGQYTFASSDTSAWHLITMVRSGTTITFYVDGNPAGTSSTTPSSPTGATTVGYDSNGHYFNGAIDDVRIFAGSLSSSDVLKVRRFTYNLLSSSSVAYDDVYPTSITAYDGVSTPRELFYDMSTCVVMPCVAGGNMEDLSGHGKDGAITGTQNNPSGKIGSARTFNNNGDRIQASNINLGQSFSVSLWVNPTSGQTDVEGVLVKEESAFSVMMTSTRFVKAYFYDGASWQPLGSNSTLPSGQWSHVTVTYAQVGTKTAVYIYVNGGLIGGNAATITGNVASSTAPVMFGALPDATQRFYGSEDEVHIIPTVITASQVSDIYNGVEKSHMSRSYQDGLGRTTRSVVMDMFGTKLTTFATLGWNDKPIYSYLPSGQYSTFTYDFLSRTLTTQSPGDSTISGISRSIISEKARMVESVDAVGRKAYVKTDLLGRAIETGVWNVSSRAYGNWTNASYNALSEVTLSKDAKGQITTTYYNSLGKPKMTVFPDGTYSVVYYDDNLRAFKTVDVMGRVSVSAYDSIGRVTSETVTDDTWLSPISGTSTYYNTWTSVTGCTSTTHYDCVNDGTSPDDATSYVSTTTTSQKESHLMQPLTVPGGYTNIDVTWEGRCQRATSSPGGQISHLVRETDGTATESVGADKEFTCPSGSWQTFTYFMDKAPDGAEWTPAEISALQCGYMSSTDVSPAPQVTNVRCLVHTAFVTSYLYDSHDDLTSVSTSTATNGYLYDSLHRVIQETLSIPPSGSEFSKSLVYQYDNANKVTDIQYPTGYHAAYTYDSLARIRQVNYATSKYAELAYDTFGRLGSIYYWSGATNTTLQEKYAYDARDRATQVKVSSSSQTYMQLDYTYNKASEITAVTDNMYINDTGTDGISNPKTVTYSYDGNGRLARFTGPFIAGNQGPIDNCYDYDAVGNILHWKQTACTAPNTYAYGTSWNELQTLSYNSMSFTYNAAGSMLTKTENSVTTTYTQDFLQQLVKVVSGSNTYTYSYDGLGRRIKTIDPTQTMYFMYSGSKMMYSRVGTSSTETDYVYVGSRLLLRRDGPTAYVRYYHDDISPGNVRLITYYDTAVRDDAKYRYKPFGDVLILKGSTQRFQYAQQEYDGSTIRQYHMGLRYQDPVVGRFAQRDPIGPGYSYASNNPIGYIDSSGGATAQSWGTPASNFQNWLGSPQGLIVLITVNVALLALGIPSGAIAEAIVAGTVVGAIFVVATFVLSGGTATAGEYLGAFLLGFAVGTTIVSIYSNFGVLGSAELGAGKASLSEARSVETGFDETASRAYAQEEGFIGQAPEARLTNAESVGANAKTLADPSEGYSSFDAFKKDFGKRPFGGDPDSEWHHVVEQRAGNTNAFGMERIQNPDNIVGIETRIHNKISYFYSSKVRVISGELTIREWLSTQSFEEQYEFGMRILNRALAGEL